MLNLDYNLVIIWNYTVTIEVHCFWFFLVNSCWLVNELMLAFANLTIRTEICFYILNFYITSVLGLFLDI